MPINAVYALLFHTSSSRLPGYPMALHPSSSPAHESSHISFVSAGTGVSSLPFNPHLFIAMLPLHFPFLRLNLLLLRGLCFGGRCDGRLGYYRLCCGIGLYDLALDLRDAVLGLENADLGYF